MQSEYWTLVDERGMGLYLVDSEEDALKWCHADYGGANVIRPLRVYMAHELVAAEQSAYERGIRKAASICYELGEKVMHPTQTITSRCEKAILAEIGEQMIDDTQRTHYPGCERDHRECLIQRMADEIERLRDELQMAKDAALEDNEIERLHADNQAAVRAYAAEITEASGEIERLRTELGDVSEKLMIAGTDLAGARAEIERLHSYNDALRNVNEIRWDEAVRLNNENDLLRVDLTEAYAALDAQVLVSQKLHREVVELRADAERYRWLRNEHKLLDPLCRLVWKFDGDRMSNEWVETVNIDAEIDEAMKEQKE